MDMTEPLSEERIEELSFNMAVQFTSEEIANGYHRCRMYDGLVVGPEHPNGDWGLDPDECLCGYANPRLNKDFIVKE